ncbi:MAG: hypothetical protein VXV82_04245, partial [Bacteroidota bacterium]|nr:hypothetical protein [Bacteroidota bacterium]
RINEQNSIVLGSSNSTLSQSVLLGINNSAGRLSVAIGNNNVTGVSRNVLIGNNNTQTSVSDGVIIGRLNSATSNFAYIIGQQNQNSGEFALVVNRNNTALGNYNFVAGRGNVGRSYGEAVFGHYSDTYVPTGTGNSIVPTDRLFSIGNGATATNRSNALTILQSGNMGLGNTPEGLNPPNLLTLDNGATDPLKINNLATDNTLTQILVIDGNGVVHLRDIGTLPIPAPGPGNPSGLGVADINTLQQTIQQQQGQINALIQQNQDLLFRLEQLELGNNPTNP